VKGDTMRFALTGARDDVAGSLALAARFTASHGSTPQLNCIRIRHSVKEGVTHAEATDQRMSVRSHLWVASDEPEVEVLAHTDLVRAVRAMPAGEVTITKEEDGQVLTVSGTGRSKYTVSLGDGAPVSAFPGEEQIDWDQIAEVDAADAMRIMQQAARFASRKDGNPSITGVSLRVVNGELSIDATDGFRLFHDRVALPSAGFPFDEDEVLVPPAMVEELGRTFPSGKLRLAATQNLLFARDDAGETLFAARRIGGKFPSLDEVVPEFDQINVQVPREELAAALKRIGGVAKGKPVKLEFSGDTLRLSARGEATSAEEWVDLGGVAGEGEMVIAFNVDFLEEGVELFSDDSVKLEMLTALRPARLSGDGARFFLLASVKVP
jgi:DNA polymerase-3 subunit beta